MSLPSKLKRSENNKFPKTNRILKSRDFAQVHKKSRKLYSENFTIFSAKTDKEATSQVRLGITVSKKTEKSSVKRNRIKRIIREAFRRIKCNCIPNLSIIIVAKNNCIKSDSKKIRLELLNLLKITACLIDK